jgi:ADP-ribose pyrophosphatase
MNILFANKWVELVELGDWYYVRRPNGTRNVLVVAFDKADRLILIEQYRPPVGRSVIELPAGIVAPGEEVMAAGVRELMEETGYEIDGDESLHLTSVVTSPGITDEEAHVIVAHSAVKVGNGGGLAHEGENIRVHEVELQDLRAFLYVKQLNGSAISATIYASLLVAADRDYYRQLFREKGFT